MWRYSLCGELSLCGDRENQTSSVWRGEPLCGGFKPLCGGMNLCVEVLSLCVEALREFIKQCFLPLKNKGEKHNIYSIKTIWHENINLVRMVIIFGLFLK